MHPLISHIAQLCHRSAAAASVRARGLACIVAALCALAAGAQQYRFEIGPALGMSGYLGDVNNSNVFKHPGIAGGAVFRYNPNSRWALKANLLYASISGNSADMQSQLPAGQTLDFKSRLIAFGGQVVFPGDIVIGDTDGMIFVRPSEAEEILEKRKLYQYMIT